MPIIALLCGLHFGIPLFILQTLEEEEVSELAQGSAIGRNLIVKVDPQKPLEGAPIVNAVLQSLVGQTEASLQTEAFQLVFGSETFSARLSSFDVRADKTSQVVLWDNGLHKFQKFAFGYANGTAIYDME